MLTVFAVLLTGFDGSTCCMEYTWHDWVPVLVLWLRRMGFLGRNSSDNGESQSEGISFLLLAHGQISFLGTWHK